jgi:hypothetical protein
VNITENRHLVIWFKKIALLAVILLSHTSVASEESYQLEELIQLPLSASSTVVALEPVPNTTQQYLLADNHGAIFSLTNHELTPLAALNYNNHSDTPLPIDFKSLALHPSFSLPDQPGYLTFYTAHIEAIKTQTGTNRLTALNSQEVLPFDATIIEWQLDATDSSKIAAGSRREVMRIGLPTPSMDALQIAFDPFGKPWHDNYAFLYISLSASDMTNQSPLYSGAILCINPTKFGLRSYTVPTTNPFIKNKTINNEIIILGGQKIHSFNWSKQHFGQLLVSHSYKEKNQLSLLSSGADLRNNLSKVSSFNLGDETIPSRPLLYSARFSKALWGKVVFLSNKHNDWRLKTFPLQTVSDEQALSPKKVWEFPSQILPSAQQVTMYADNDGEILLMESKNHTLFSLTSSAVIAEPLENQPSSLKQEEQTEQGSSYGYLLLTLLLSVLGIIFYRLRPRHQAAKFQLRNQFARFEISDSKQSLHLYKRHETDSNTEILIRDIIESEIILGEETCCLVSGRTDDFCSAKREKELRVSFAAEHQHKMIDEKTRQVILKLTDKHEQLFTICLYLRKGNQRLTKAKYFDVLENLIDWSWFISKQLNPQATEKRKMKVSMSASVATHTKKTIKPLVKQDIQPEASVKSAAVVLNNATNPDSELINSLDKLVSLRQAGHLSEQEFSLAKAKILADMTNK